MKINPGILFTLIFTVVIVIIVILSFYFSKNAIVKRKLKKIPYKRISEFVTGEISKIVGKVEFAGNPLIAPLSGRKCAAYFVQVEQRISTGKNSHWKKIISEEVFGGFVVKDGRQCAHISTVNIKSYIVQDIQYKSGFRNNATEEMEKYLDNHGNKSTGTFGLNKTLRFKEGILEDGEIIAVAGRGEWKSAVQLKLPESYGRVLEITSIDENPVYLSNHKDTVIVPFNEYPGMGTL